MFRNNGFGDGRGRGQVAAAQKRARKRKRAPGTSSCGQGATMGSNCDTDGRGYPITLRIMSSGPNNKSIQIGLLFGWGFSL